MAHVTFKQLRYFDALARQLHFGRAADECAVSQPALSMQIQELEQQLGIALVERTRSGIHMTAKGSEIAVRAARILGEVRNLVEYATYTGETLSGGLRLGVIPSIAPYLLPPLLPILRQGYPLLELSVRETQTAPLLQELGEGKLDVVLLALPVHHPDIDTEHLFQDRFFLVLPKAQKLSGRVRATPDLVQQDRLLLLEEGHCLRDQALAYCSLQHSPALNTFGASSLSTLVEMVAGGLGITLVPEMAVAMEGRGRDLTILPFTEPEPSRSIGLAWRTSSPRMQDFRALAEAVRKAWTLVHENSAAMLQAGPTKKPSATSS